MSYFPNKYQPQELISTDYYLNQADAFITSQDCFVEAKINLDFSIAAVTTIFTTDSNNGRFFPIALAVETQESRSGGGNGTFTLGWNSTSFNNWGTYQVQGATTTTFTFGSGQYQTYKLSSVVGLSAPVNTAIKINITSPTAPNTGAVPPGVDFRTISVFGFYVG